MITKDELKRLEQPSRQNKELHYTIGGSVESAVHSNLESERISKLNKGHRIMNKAVQQFENNMAFKSREGLAHSQFQQLVNSEPPPPDRKLAEQTWQDNHKVAHQETFDKARKQFRSAMQQATQGELPIIDTDSGYGAGQDNTTVEKYVNHTTKEQQPVRNERVKAFAQNMTQDRSQGLER